MNAKVTHQESGTEPKHRIGSRFNVRHMVLMMHRYAGLAMAAFLVVIALTGSIIVFNSELMHALDPPPRVTSQGLALLDGIELRQRAQAIEPRASFNAALLHLSPDEGAAFSAEPRVDPTTGRPFQLSFDTLYLDPYTGQELRRLHGSDALWPITRQNLVPLINRLHYSLALPGTWGTWLFGGIALLWTLDCVLSVYLTFPARGSRAAPRAGRTRSWLARWWKPSWLVKWRGSALRVNFDLHRAGSLWLWLLLFVFAWSGVGFNLSTQVYTPVMRTLFGMPDAYGGEAPPLSAPRPDPRLEWGAARLVARSAVQAQAVRLGFTVESEQGLYYTPDKAEFLYAIRSDRDLYSDTGATVLRLSDDGRVLSFSLPRGQNLGRTIDTWLFALHIAGVGGLPYRLFVSFLGLAICGLSITGVYIWWRKRCPRVGRLENDPAST